MDTNGFVEAKAVNAFAVSCHTLWGAVFLATACWVPFWDPFLQL